MIPCRCVPVLSVLVVILAGCGGGSPNAPASLSGKVTYNQKPVTAGTITLHTNESGIYNLYITPEGTYSSTDLPAGELVVTIETESANRPKITYGGKQGKDKMMSPTPEGANAVPSGTYVKIPAKYADKKTSDLKVTLTNGKQTKNFELTD